MFSTLLLAQAAPIAAATEIVQPQDVRPLPGQLDQVPVFNSNSPELVQSEGILLSTFPGQGKRVPQAHLNFPFDGRFDLFAHHVARAKTKQDKRPLYFGVLLHNPTLKAVKVLVLHGSTSYSNQDAPFRLHEEAPPLVRNPSRRELLGPGSRAAYDVLYRQNRRQTDWPPRSLAIPPQQSKMLVNLPISASPTSSRTTWMRLSSNGKLYAASLALFARPQTNGDLRAPQLREWQQLLQRGNLVSPRDKPPSPPGSRGAKFYYGRVAGVAQGVQWRATLTNRPSGRVLSIPQAGQAFSYALNTLERGTLGTGQIQSAPMLARYPDTAYRANGNYGIKYDLTLPLHNPTASAQTVALSLQTPIKEDRLSQKGLRFFRNPAGTIFFRGPVRLYPDARERRSLAFHLTQRRGQQGSPLATFKLAPGDQRPVRLEFVYPPDATPPQVLTVRTLAP